MSKAITTNTVPVLLRNSAKTVHDEIDELLKEHNNWRQADNASREGLYANIANCLGFHERLSEQSTEGEALRVEFGTYLQETGLKFNKKTELAVKIVRVLFKNDRRRYSEYGRVLRVAIANGITRDGLPDFIRTSGGLQKVRFEAKADTRASNASKGRDTWNALKGAAALAEVSAPDLIAGTDLGDIGQPVVLLAIRQANGVFAIHGVVTTGKVVDIAYAAYGGQVPAAPMATNDTAPVDDADSASAALIAQVEAQS